MDSYHYILHLIFTGSLMNFFCRMWRAMAGGSFFWIRQKKRNRRWRRGNIPWLPVRLPCLNVSPDKFSKQRIQKEKRDAGKSNRIPASVSKDYKLWFSTMGSKRSREQCLSDVKCLHVTQETSTLLDLLVQLQQPFTS